MFYQLIAGHQHVELTVGFAGVGFPVHHLIISFREFNQLIAGNQHVELAVGTTEYIFLLEMKQG